MQQNCGIILQASAGLQDNALKKKAGRYNNNNRVLPSSDYTHPRTGDGQGGHWEGNQNWQNEKIIRKELQLLAPLEAQCGVGGEEKVSFP